MCLPVADQLMKGFLRQVEFYRGILFLTTNVRRHFDQAVLSRIHVKLKYTARSDISVRRIWKKHLVQRQFSEEDAAALASALTEENTLDFRAMENVIHLADILARSDSGGSKLTKEHIDHAIKMQCLDEIEIIEPNLAEGDALDSYD
jgi:hypothetical protein